MHQAQEQECRAGSRKAMRKQRKKRAKKDELQRLTRAVTHIPMPETNAGKLAALDQLAQVYLGLTQQYTTLFCTDESPNSFRAPCFPTELSERWHRVAIQQAAGVAKSWRTNREAAYRDYLETLAEYQEQQADGTDEERQKEPEWGEWNIPTLQQTCIQANANVVKLEASHDSTFDYWLTISTLAFRQQLFVPVKLADYHKQALTDPKTNRRRTINSSVTLNKRGGCWWLTLTFDEEIKIVTAPDAPVVGIDVGIANFVTTSTGKQYGTMHGQLRARHKRV